MNGLSHGSEEDVQGDLGGGIAVGSQTWRARAWIALAVIIVASGLTAGPSAPPAAAATSLTRITRVNGRRVLISFSASDKSFTVTDPTNPSAPPMCGGRSIIAALASTPEALNVRSTGIS